MKKTFASLFFASALFWGCSKTESTPDPEPAEQVIGAYDVDKITESFKLDISPSEQLDVLNLPFKSATGDQLSATLDVAKKSANVVTMVFVQTLKYANGKTDSQRDAFEDIELKKNDAVAGQFDMLISGTKVGTIGNKSILIEEVENGKDSLGRKYTYKFQISGKKK
jgi:hypothetical protein